MKRALDILAAGFLLLPWLLLVAGLLLILALPICLAATHHDYTAVIGVYGALALSAGLFWARRRVS